MNTSTVKILGRWVLITRPTSSVLRIGNWQWVSIQPAEFFYFFGERL